MGRAYTVGGEPNWELIPEHMREGVRAYVERGVPTAGFLKAVFSNDLMEAVGRADATNRRYLHHYAMFFYQYLPTECYGSPAKVEAWIKQKGLDGK